MYMWVLIAMEAGSCGRRQEEEVDNTLYSLSLLPGPRMGMGVSGGRGGMG